MQEEVQVVGNQHYQIKKMTKAFTLLILILHLEKQRHYKAYGGWNVK